MNKKYNKFLIISTIAIFIGLGYSYFSKDVVSNDVVPIAFGSSLSSSTGEEVLPVTPNEDKISSDISFLTALVSLKNIKIDTTLFSDRSFNRLKDNGVKIEQVKAGRPNPFAPVSASEAIEVVSTPSVLTNQPGEITTKTAVLNGAIINVSAVNDSYFEYGTTMNLGINTGPVEISLLGTFFKNVLNLTPKTTYYFKACSKVNNAPLCGSIVSFTTK